MTAVCGICVSNAVEENCYILMPGCGHVFDRACITNSVGVEYTCPECENKYLLPSPYRPFQLANSTDFIEYKELHKHLIKANQTIIHLQDELAKAHEDLELEQRSRKKSNDSLIILTQQLVALQEKYKHLGHNETSHLAVDVIFEEAASINVDQAPSEIQVTATPTTPMPTATTETRNEKPTIEQPPIEQPEDTRSKLLVYYNARIQQLNASIPDAQGSQKKAMKRHLKLISENKAMVEKLHTLVYLTSKIASNLSKSRSDTHCIGAKQKDIISKLSASTKKAKEMDDATIEEKKDKIKVYADKILELEKAASLLDIGDLEAVESEYQQHKKLLPNGTQMYAFSTVSKHLKKIKAKHAKLIKTTEDFKREKLQEKLEHILTKSKRFQERIDSHTTIIEQAEQMNQDLQAFLDE